MIETKWRLWFLSGILAGLSGCVTPQDRADSAGYAPRFLAFTSFSRFHKSAGSHPHQTVILSPELKTPIPWDELVVSWNAIVPPGTGLKFEARAIYPDRATRYYTLGYWAEDARQQRRESVRDQKDDDGEVKTDIMVLNHLADRLQLRVTLFGASDHIMPRLKLLGLSLLNSRVSLTPQSGTKLAWGQALAVPERSQLSYQGGRDWCSPTSVSMVLAYWAEVLQRAELDADVPAVAAGVHDRNWPGTGNWPFNMAFAGRFEGMRGCVTRLADISELEMLVAARIPPVVSVSYDLLHGWSPDRGNGHLVVCVGFTEQGDVVVNDPWADFKKGDRVRQVVLRENFVKAWRHSRQTAYLIRPERWALPKSARW